MKKIKKVVSLMLLTFIVASVVAVPVMAATDPPYSYGWLMPAEFKGSAAVHRFDGKNICLYDALCQPIN